MAPSIVTNLVPTVTHARHHPPPPQHPHLVASTTVASVAASDDRSRNADRFFLAAPEASASFAPWDPTALAASDPVRPAEDPDGALFFAFFSH